MTPCSLAFFIFTTVRTSIIIIIIIIIYGNTSRQKCHAKGSRKEVKIREFTYRDATTVEHEVYDYNGNNWSHRNSYKSLN
jgi:hypothetical protein